MAFRTGNSLSDEIFAFTTKATTDLQEKIDQALKNGLISEAQRHALAFVILGANAAVFSFFVDKGAPFRKICRSELVSNDSPVDAYIVLLRIFFYLLDKSMQNDNSLNVSINATIDNIIKSFSEATEYSPDVFDLSWYREIESREGVGYTLDVSLDDFRQTLCGRIEGLSGWSVPGIPKSAGYAATIVFFHTILDLVAAHNLELLRSKLFKS